MSLWFQHGEAPERGAKMSQKSSGNRGNGTGISAIKKQVTGTTAIKPFILITAQLKAKAKLIVPLWHSWCVGFNYSCGSTQGERCKHLHVPLDPLPRGSCGSAPTACATQSGFLFTLRQSSPSWIIQQQSCISEERECFLPPVACAAIMLQTESSFQPWPLPSVSLTPNQSLSFVPEGQLMSPSTRHSSLVLQLLKWSKPLY